MGRTVGIGIQGFEKIRKEGYFYIDKTDFIKEWWESEDQVTLITRPRRFGKTLNMRMLESHFCKKSIKNAIFVLQWEGNLLKIQLSFSDYEELKRTGCLLWVRPVISGAYA